MRRRCRNKIYDDRAAITRLTFAQLKFLRYWYVPLLNGFDRKHIHRLLRIKKHLWIFLPRCQKENDTWIRKNHDRIIMTILLTANKSVQFKYC